MDQCKQNDNLVIMNFEVDLHLYEQVKELLGQYGLTPEDAVVLFLKETVRQGKIPFEYSTDRL